MSVNNQTLDMNCWHTRIAAPSSLIRLCAIGLIAAVFFTFEAGINAQSTKQSDPNSPSSLPVAQAAQDPNLSDANVPDANVTDANITTTAADPNTQLQSQTVQSIKPASGNSTANRKSLWRASIVAEVDANDKGKTELERLIAQINSMKLGKQDAAFMREPDKTSLTKNEPDTVPVKPKTPQDNITKTEQAKKPQTLPSGQLPPETLGILGKHIQEPQKMIEPFELAEILYRSGHLSQAAVAYQQALAQMDPDDSTLATRRAWTLAQIGNCLRRTKPQEAMKSYQQLMNDYPASPWAGLAVAMNGVLNWLDQDKPRDLVVEVQQLKVGLPD